MNRHASLKNSILGGAVFALASALIIPGQAQDRVVYDNTFHERDTVFTSSVEFGDEIVLWGTDRIFREFEFETFSENPSDEASAVIRFYENDGEDVGLGLAPGSLLFESSAIDLTGGSETHTFTANPFRLPDELTWTIEFSNLGAGDAGLPLAHPIDQGGNFDDFWRRGDDGWDLLRFEGGEPPGNFRAKIKAAEMTMSVAENSLTIQFSEGTLETAPSVTGPWTESEQSSPASFATDDAEAQFFRLVP